MNEMSDHTKKQRHNTGDNMKPENDDGQCSLGTQNQQQQIMNDHERNLLAEALDQEEEGEALFSSNVKSDHDDEILHNYQKSLTLRESVHGRYHGLVARSYSLMGKAYQNTSDPRAVVAYRTFYRINLMLYGKCNGPISPPFKEILKDRGLGIDEINDIGQDIATSVRYEMIGDMHRRVGSRKEAGVEYQKAARLEEFSFGRENPNLAFLWRKMAFLACIKRGRIRHLEFDRTTDLINSPWMKRFKDNLYAPVCQAIFRGDCYYVEFQYDHAVGEYVKATSIGRTCFQLEEEASEYPPKPPLSKTGTTGRRKGKTNSESRYRRKKRNATSSSSTGKHGHSNSMIDQSSPSLPAALVDESGNKKSSMRSSHHGSASISLEDFISESSHTRQHANHPGQEKRTHDMMGELEKLLSEDVSGNPTVMRRPEEASPATTISKSVSLAAFTISPVPTTTTTTTTQHKSSPILAAPVVHGPSPVQGGIEVPKELETELSIPVVSHTRRSSVSGGAAGTTVSKRPKSDTMSKSRHRRPSSQRFSRRTTDAGVYTTNAIREAVKPKSMSFLGSTPNHHLSKELSRVPAGGTSREEEAPKTTTATPTTIKDDVDVDDIDDTVKPKSEPSLSYSAVTPEDPTSHDNEKKPNSMPSLLGSPSTNNSPEENEEGELDKFLIKVLQQENSTATAFLEKHTDNKDDVDTKQMKESSNHPPPVVVHDIAGAATVPSISITTPETPGSLKSFLEFSKSPSGGITLDNKSLSGLSLLSSSVATTKENSLERFLSETAKAAAALEEKEPSLIEMLAHVQKIAGLLQKQTFFLKSDLGEQQQQQQQQQATDTTLPPPLLPPSQYDTRSRLSSNSPLEVSNRIEELFKNCFRIVEMATSRIEEKESTTTFLNPALVEYRKTFALEKVFLDQLKQGFVDAGRIPPSSTVPTSSSGVDHYYSSASPHSNYDLQQPAIQQKTDEFAFAGEFASEMESQFSVSSSFTDQNENENDDNYDDDTNYFPLKDDEGKDLQEETRSPSQQSSKALVFEDGSDSQYIDA